MIFSVSLVFVVFQKEPMHRTFQQNVRGQIDVFFPDPSKYDLAPQKQKHWALDKPKVKKTVSQIKVEPAPEIEGNFSNHLKNISSNIFKIISKIFRKRTGKVRKRDANQP